MAGKQQARREEAARRLLETAVACVEDEGLDALHARELARRSGYSVGTVYKYYKDLDDVIVKVNSVTLGRIKQAVGEAVADKADPLDRLKALAHAYLRFASSNKRLWEALFKHLLQDDDLIPEEHRRDNIELLSAIGGALMEIDPGLTPPDLESRTRACFAAVHGIVAMSIERRFIGLTGKALDRELDRVVERLARPD